MPLGTDRVSLAETSKTQQTSQEDNTEIYELETGEL